MSFYFRPEGPSQVFMNVVNMMYRKLEALPSQKRQEAIKSYTLSYDSMCHLDTLDATCEDLPLPVPYNTMWKDIYKVIDRLHLINHKDPHCKTNNNPDDILSEGNNIMASEQLFSWMSRFKKIVNSMTQTHRLFYLHHMCNRRNRYTGRCKFRGAESVLHAINSKLVGRKK